MDAKLSNFSELSNILSVKSSLRTNLMALFTRFGLGHLLCRMSLEKQAGVPAVQLILSLCLFRIAGESIHSMYKKSYYDLLNTGHNCYYRMLRRATMDWRKLLLGMALRFWAILRKEHAEVSSDNTSYIFDDTTLEKTGYGIEQISRVFDHVQGKCVLGFKLLVCAFFDGKSTIPIDMSLHCEKGKKKDYGLTAKQRKHRFSKKTQERRPQLHKIQRINAVEASCCRGNAKARMGSQEFACQVCALRQLVHLRVLYQRGSQARQGRLAPCRTGKDGQHQVLCVWEVAQCHGTNSAIRRQPSILP